MDIRAAVAGASGYAGGEILRILLNHRDIEVCAVTAGQSQGQALGTFHPHLGPLADMVIGPSDLEHLGDADVVFFALPHGASGQLTQELQDAGFQGKLVDCGADHRLTSQAAWEAFYGQGFQEPWTYGMPELLHAGETQARAQRAQLSATQTIAVPGCNVTAITLGIQPGVAAGLVDAKDIVAVLSVGYSGAGKSLKPNLLAAEALGNIAPYAVGGTHRHIPEVEQNLEVSGASSPRVSFTPVLVPTSRGILATITAPLIGEAKGVREAWEQAYGNEPLIRVLPEGVWPTTSPIIGTGCADVQVTVDERAGKVIAVCAIDNLGKGTAAAAVQSLNLALGIEETTGIPQIGVAP
ncbi:MAG: N-acetyl-gamma-glutamyl-phosphate reductase [Actinomycetaceae bacterium]|nr:N-acetyl-gamma-glutamyl-phosphate reductase [Actinomycetaceae bacterium]